MKQDEVMRGKIQAIKPYGAFVELEDGRKGLVHISEISDRYVHDIEDYLKKGKTYRFKVLTIDEHGRAALSLKALKRRRKRLKIHLKRGFSPLGKRLGGWIQHYKQKHREILEDHSEGEDHD